ncbi:MAG: hypothetical protein ACJ8D5_06330 [Sphingomicrobium sp.]
MIGSDQFARPVSGSRAYRTGLAVAAITSVLTVWTTIVRDDGNGGGFFTLIMAVAVGWFAAWFRPAGMARTMVGVAAMQVVLGMLIATAPITANVPGESFKALVFSGVFAGLWLVSGAFFRAAAKANEAPLSR